MSVAADIAAVPNLRAVGRDHVLDGTDKCGGHCLHVELMWREVRAVKRLGWFLSVCILTLLIRDVYPVVARKDREVAMPVTHPGEITYPDRVPEPNPRGSNEQ